VREREVGTRNPLAVFSGKDANLLSVQKMPRSAHRWRARADVDGQDEPVHLTLFREQIMFLRRAGIDINMADYNERGLQRVPVRLKMREDDTLTIDGMYDTEGELVLIDEERKRLQQSAGAYAVHAGKSRRIS
jgi:hypothetical protein